MKIIFLYNEIIIKYKNEKEKDKINNIFENSLNNCTINKFKNDYNINKDNNTNISLIKKKNLIKIEYEVSKWDNKIKIFGDIFVNNNKNKCFIVNKGIKYNLSEYFTIKNKKKSKLKIELAGIKNVFNLESMFYSCSSLISIKDIYNWNINKVTNISKLFYNCLDLKSIPDISYWKTNNVTDMNHLFCNCMGLKSIPDISIWNTDKLIDMSFLFFNCLNLYLIF